MYLYLCVFWTDIFEVHVTPMNNTIDNILGENQKEAKQNYNPNLKPL